MRRAALALVLIGIAMPARAQQPASDEACQGEPAECGKQEFEAGIKAYQAGDFGNAAQHFERAHGHRAHPVVLFNWALAEARANKPVDAIAKFERVLADAQTPEELKSKVEAEREKVNRNISRVVLDASGKKVELFVDDAPHGGDPPTATLNPGRHAVRVTIDGKVALTREIDVRPGETLRLSVSATKDAPKGGGVGGDAGRETRPAPRVGKPLEPIWFFVGAGATLVAGGVAVWSGLDTKNAFDEYERDLPRLTQAQADARVSDGHDRELRTNILIGATAGLGVATAVVGAFFVDWSRESPRERGGLLLGPGHVGYAGRF